MMKGCGNMKLGDYIFEYSQRNKEDKNYPVYSVTNTLGFCQEYFSKDVSGKDKTTYKLVPRGYFAYNPSRINVGSVDWQKSEDCVIVSPLYVVFGLKDTLKPEYLKYYLKSKPTNELIKLSTSGTVRDNLKYSSLEKFPIPVPSIEEQKAICSLLDKINRVIEAKKEQLKELDNLAQAIFYDMFGDPITNEKGWETQILGDVCTLKAGKSIKASELSETMNVNLFPCYGGNGVRGYIDRYSHNRPLPIIGRQGALCGNVNFAKAPFYATEHAVVVAPKTIMDVVWLFYVLKLMHLNQYAHGVAQPGLSVQDIEPLPLILPPLPLQQAFAEKVEAIERQKELINQSLREVQTLFDSRMDYWFSEENDDLGQLDKLD